MSNLELYVNRTVKFSISGEARIEAIGPTLSYETWTINRIATHSNGQDESYLYMYRGAINPGNLIGGTYSGNFDTSETELHLAAGQYLTFHYTNGTPSGFATITLSGIRIIHAKVYG